jgi:hypothetical protein
MPTVGVASSKNVRRPGTMSVTAKQAPSAAHIALTAWRRRRPCASSTMTR